jgi:hypothetical protein
MYGHNASPMVSLPREPLDHVARYQPEDAELFGPGLACPYCSASGPRLMVHGEGHEVSAVCRCSDCAAMWTTTLDNHEQPVA